MDDVSLVSFLRRNPLIRNIIFPTELERNISANEILDAMTFEKRYDSETNSAPGIFARLVFDFARLGFEILPTAVNF